MVKRNVRKTSKAGKVVNKMMSEESEEMLLMDIALCEGVEIETLFESEVRFYAGAIVEE